MDGIPTYDRFIEPLLRFLAVHPEGAPARTAQEGAAGELGLSEAQKAQLLPSGLQAVYRNRVGWAHDRLKRVGFSESPRRGYWRITQAGVDYLALWPGPLPEDEVDRIASTNLYAKLSALHGDGDGEGDGGPSGADTSTERGAGGTEAAVSTPDDRLEQALIEIRESVAAEILELIGNSEPSFFEGLVLDLLHALGYGTSRDDLRRVGGSGDEGIDGIISLDRLGLEKVYVQAKRWKNTVGRPLVQEFYGALAGQRATKGVFITTSSFTANAWEFANSVERIVLVDGAALTRYMMDIGVGVSHRVVRIPRVDVDYYEG